MSEAERIEQLLRRWQEARATGQTPTVEELCRDCPDLADPLRRRLRDMAETTLELGSITGPVPPPPRRPAASSPLRYVLLRPLGKGNLGEVHVAFDQELHREVALKQIQEHLADHPDLRKRFLLEAEVTGRLEHPGIVPVYGLGCYADGRPFYAMRLIKGESLQEAITRFHQADTPDRAPGERGLALRGLLTRFVAVCNTMAYAHSKGVVHRDLKPSNIMLGAYGETLVVDWGLARPIPRTEADHSSGEETLTPANRPEATRGALGSPAYMSPEQASGTQSLVGPASDVYSLGATLYHLLTGTAPFDKGSLEEVLRRVQRGDFPPPRSRKPDVPQALEAVCLKAMALDRDQRYPGAAQLAADVEAYLADEPVSAWREPLADRTRRWLKRRRTAVVTTLAAGAVALVALSVSTVLLEAARERERAARADAESSAARERKQRERAEGLFHLAERTSGTLLELAEEFKPAAEVQARATEHVLLQARRRYEQLLQEGGARPQLLEGQARVLTALSEVRVTLGDTTAARDLAAEAVALYRQLRQGNPDSVSYQAGEAAAREQLAQPLMAQGDLDGALREHRAALRLREELGQAQPQQRRWAALQARSHNFLGNVLRVQGLDRSAEAEFRKALALCQEVVRREPRNDFARTRLAASLGKIGDCLAAREDLADAAGHYEEALAQLAALLQDGHATTPLLQQQASVRLSLGWTLHDLGQPQKARGYYDQALGDAERFFQLDPGNREWERLRMQALIYANQFRRRDDPATEVRVQAELFRASLQTIDRRVQRDPANLDWVAQQAGVRRLLAGTLLALANQRIDRDRNLAEAAGLLDASAKQLQRLHRQVPDNVEFAESLASTYQARLTLRRLRGEGPDPVGLIRQRQALLEAYYRRRIQEGVDVPLWEGRLALLLRNVANDHGWIDQELDSGLKAAREATALYEKLHQAEPTVGPWLQGVADSHEAAHRLLSLLASEQAEKKAPAKGLADLAARHFARRLEARERLVRLQPNNLRAHLALAETYRELADDLRLGGDKAGEDANYQKYLDTLEGLYRQFPEEAARDPFVDPGPAKLGAFIGGQAVSPGTRFLREGFELREQIHWVTRRQRLGVEIAELAIALVQRLDLKDPAQVRQARWAVRRGLGLLRELYEAKALHPVHARLLPFFEAKLRELRDPRDAELVPEGWRRAWDGLAFAELARLARQEGRLADLVRLLDRAAEDAAGLPWLTRAVGYRMLEPLLLTPGLADEVLAVARQQAGRLSQPGRERFAWLGRLARDTQAVQELAPEVADGPHPELLSEMIAIRLEQAGQLARGARLYDDAMRAKKEKATAEDFKLAGQSWLGANHPAEAADALREALQLDPKDAEARVLLAEALRAARRFGEARTLTARALALKDWPGDTLHDLRVLRARLLAEDGNADQAERELRQLLLEGRHDLRAGPALALLLAGQGKDLVEATRLAETLRKKHPAARNCAVAEAAVKVAAGKAKEALPELERLAQAEPTCFDPVVFSYLGDAYSRLGRPAEARRSWEKALSLLPGAAKEDRLVQRLKSRLGQPDKKP